VAGFFISMSQTLLDIANSALVKLGGRTIPAFPSSATKEGELVSARLLPCLRQMTRSHVWAFLKAYTMLNVPTPSTLTPWSHQHTLPANLGRIVSVTVGSFRVAYERIGNAIHTYNDAVRLRYIRNPVTSGESADTYPDDFAETLACYLAADICRSLTQDSEMRAEMLQQYDGLLRQARFNGAVERSLMAIEGEEWNESRDYWNDWAPSGQHNAVPPEGV
jgi:hypothetical protein